MSWRPHLHRLSLERAFPVRSLFAEPATLVQCGFSIRDTVNLGAEIAEQAACDTLEEGSQLCVRPTSRR